MKRNKFLLIAAFAALLVSCGGGKKQGKPDFGDNEYAVRTIQGQNADLQTTYPATIKGVQDVEIRPKVSGFITKLCVKEGQNVKAGQLLFVIDNVTFEAAVRQAKASVSAAKAALATAKLTYENNQKLFKNNVIGAFDLQSSQNNYESAKAQLADHSGLVTELYRMATTEVYDEGSCCFSNAAASYLKDIRFCGKEWLMERCEARIKKAGY